jgi:hypothetical protein
MSCLFNQILSVCVLLLGTYLTSVHVGDSREAIRTRLRLEVELGDPKWSRSPAYARLKMTTAEEDYMVHWSLLPQRSNKWWWDKYEHEHLAPLRRAKGEVSNEETIDSNDS